MKTLLIEVPTWLGDAVMATPAIKNLIEHFDDHSITVVGSTVSASLFQDFPRVKKTFIDNTRKKRFRLPSIYRLGKKIGKHDISITFRNSFSSALLLRFTGSKIRAGRTNGLRDLLFNKVLSFKKDCHQVERYKIMVEELIQNKIESDDLYLPFPVFRFKKACIGINPGAAYGNAKRWYSERFAEVAASLSEKFDIVIFGGPNEIMVSMEIEKRLREMNVQNFINLAGKTTIGELCSKIAGLKLFITGDSGPMHIAAAYKVPTVAIFGPTDPKDTSQWKNPYSAIVHSDIECVPCLKRECPINTHECMKSIEVEDVLKAVRDLLDSEENKEYS